MDPILLEILTPEQFGFLISLTGILCGLVIAYAFIRNI